MAERLTDGERFWGKVDKGSECWAWTAARRKGRIRHGKYHEYGTFWFRGKMVPAHRVAWTLTRGEITNGLVVCHHCDNGLCVRPDHLFLGTQSENMKDAVRKGRVAPGKRPLSQRQTHCSQGHPFDEVNTLVYLGRRHCRTCKAQRDRERCFVAKAERRLRAFGLTERALAGEE